MTPPLPDEPRHGFLHRIRTLLFTGLLVIGPTAVTVWVLFWLLNRVDNLLGRYFRFAALEYHRIPGIGLLAVALILIVVGWVASWIGSRQIGVMWDAFLSRLPGLGILYGSTKSLGEAFFTTRKETSFRQVVLVQWPLPGIYRVGFITGRAGPDVRQHLGDDIEVVFVPHSPNPASGFVHYAHRETIVYLEDWTIEDGLKVIVSGGAVQPDAIPERGAAAAAAIAANPPRTPVGPGPPASAVGQG
jgi:uncharacterized membrane protein